MIPYMVAPLAQNDLDEIWSYVANDNLVAADRLMVLFHRKFLLLSSQPLIGESREELQPGLRAFAVGNYVIFYRPVQKGIEIARVTHSARDIGTQF